MSATGGGYAGASRKRAEALRAAASAGRQRRQSGTALSKLLAQQPGSSDGRKIAAVDKGIESLDALPERYASTKTLYLSKNALRSLAGVEQFRGLKALSAADNLLSDIDCLSSLPAAGIALEAASFEGNPMADLPNYRAHVIHILGPSLAVLDNRQVSAEERAAAAGAVAHEATMLALMLSNACLVHKLGRAVQLVRLHCELQCAVLGGRYGGAAASGGGAGGRGGGGALGAAGGVLCSGRGASRMLQLWDYEASLGRQERHSICLAIRREVGRRYRKIVAAGGKPEGSSKLWQQAFAQVMLLQQETIAQLMAMLEEAKGEAASALAPLTRPPSPTKRALLESEAEAQGRVQEDREALIQELRDAFLGLADAPAHGDAPERAAQLEARIRQLHAALEAAGGRPGSAKAGAGLGSPLPSARGQQQWSIGAVRTGASSLPASPQPSVLEVAAQRRAMGTGPGPLKSAMRRPASSSGGWTPGRPAGGGQPAGDSRHRPASAALPAHEEQQLDGQPQQQQWQADDGRQQQQQWQADDGLAEYEGMEQARCKTPRPFNGGSAAEQPPRQQQWQQQPQWEQQGSPAQLRPASPQRPQSANPSQWTPNPLAREPSAGWARGSPRPGSPARDKGLQGVLHLLEREGRLNQVEALRAAISQYETQAAELQAGNHDLAESLQEVQQHVSRLEGQLSAAQQAAEEQAAAADAELSAVRRSAREERSAVQAQLAVLQQEAQAVREQQERQVAELGQQLSESKAAGQALQERLDAALAEQQRLSQAAAAEREAAAAAAARQQAEAGARQAELQARTAELEGRKAVHLTLTVVSHEEEWRAEAARAAAMEALVGDLAAQLAAINRRQRIEAESASLADRVVLRRALLRWRAVAAESARLAGSHRLAEALHRRLLLSSWFGRLRLAAHRSRMLAECEARRHRRSLLLAWQGWRAYGQDCILHRGLEAAAGLHRQSAVLRQSFAAWQQHAEACRQVDWPDWHPTMRTAAQLQRTRTLRSCFGAWRRHMSETVLPRLAAIQLRVLEQFMGSQRRAFAAWQQYLQQRREGRLQKAAAQQHFKRRLLLSWQRAAQESKQRSTAALRTALVSQRLLLGLAWRAWRQAVADKRRKAAGQALADQHLRSKLLAASWEGWQRWTAVCRGMNQRRDTRLKREAFALWRRAAKAAEKWRQADTLRRRQQRRRFRACFAAWRQAVAAKQAQRGQLAHARALLARRLLGRALAGWRRAALAGKLFHSLGLVHELQGAVERAREELEHKARQVDELNRVRVTFEGTSESLSLQVDSLDADLAAAQRQAGELQAAAHEAQRQHDAAAVALEQARAAQGAAEAAAAAATAGRDAAVVAREGAEAALAAERAAALAACQAAERRAAEAEGRAESAAAAAAEAGTRAEAATAEVRALTSERQSLAARLTEAQAESQQLSAQLEAARDESADAAALLERLAAERDKLRRKLEQAEEAAATAAAEQQAALRQAARLTELAEEQQQQCQRLQQQVAQLQGSLAGQAALQGELAQLTERCRQLEADNASMREQLDRFAAALERAERDSGDLQAALQATSDEQRALQERCQAAEAEAHQLGELVEGLRGSQAGLEEQLAAAQADSTQAAEQQQALCGAVEALTAERDSLAARAAEAEAREAAGCEERAGLEAAVGQLKEQLLSSNEVLETCRRMLGETCSARTAADQQAASLTEMLRSLKADLLLKDASIKALTRENAQRAERLRALQAQVAALSAPAAGDEPGSQLVGQHSQQQQQQQVYAAFAGGSRPGSATASAGSEGVSWGGASGRQSSLGARPGSAAVGISLHTTPAAAPAASVASLGSSLPRGGAATPASPTRSAAGAQSAPLTHHSFSFSYTPAPPSSAAPSVSNAVDPLRAWQGTPASAQAAGLPGGSSSSSGRSSSLGSRLGGPPGRGSPAAAAGCSSPSRNSIGAAGPVPGSPTAAARAASPGAAAVGAVAATRTSLPKELSDILGPHAPASLPKEVLGERQLSYLLKLVVAQRVSAQQAQQVIDSAVEGDVRPLLHMLSSVQQRRAS